MVAGSYTVLPAHSLVWCSSSSRTYPKEEEWDGRDEESWHWLATDPGGEPIGTARLLPDGQIGRMAVLADYRGYGVGAAMLDQACEKARHLGFASVFLNAQTHALSFYEASGFVAEGDEFHEAGIPHRRMTRTLAPLEDGVQRLIGASQTPDVSIRKFDATEVPWDEHGKIIRKIRESVLVRELGLDQSMVVDDTDPEVCHWHATAPDGQTIGAIRMDLNGTIGRLAVLEEFRGQGVGQALLELAVGKARRFGFREVNCMALIALGDFYRNAGFEPRGEAFAEQGLEHREYYKPLTMDDPFDRPRTAISGDDYDDDVTYRLGQDNGILLLRREEEFSNIIKEMCKQATSSIRIFSPVLEHKLYDHTEVREICSALARRNKYTQVEILVYDPHRMIKNGHALLELSRRLPSSMGIKVVDPELRQLNHEFVLADDTGLIYRHDFEVFEGYANFFDQTEASRLARQFRAAWESGILDPNLRRLRI
ncbi:MAG: GNAT family N-acetyltransferase [Gammaproteobacteria bacterium]|nr:GNAT family N-acetyltransferase [Gammaproteobacteria bacterium]